MPKIPTSEVYKLAKEAVAKMKADSRQGTKFSIDELWRYASAEIPSEQRPAASTWLTKQGLIETTGVMTSATTTARAGSPTREYRFAESRKLSKSLLAGTALLDAFHSALAGELAFSRATLLRFTAALLAKHFVILTGLSGSGKTKLAQAFARWITPPSPQCFAVVPVGADWTSNEHVLGYPDNLNGGYVQQTALNLILQAEKNPGTPHFLILDEMNLSHVERYFADLLSLIESEAELWLHHDKDADGKPKARGGVPNILKLPQNLFVIGTVNVDETTYMFSPKVLDRANVLEFRVSEEEMADFLESPASPNLDKLAEPGFSGAAFGAQFVQAASREYDAGLTDGERAQFKAEIMTFFKLLGEHGAEFGFRVGKEMARFLHFHKKLSLAGALDFRAAMDAQIVQKLLPKLHGSRNKLTGVLWALAGLCWQDHEWKTQADEKKRAEAFAKFMSDVRAAVEAGDEKFDPARIADKLRAENKEAHYPLSFDKIVRMWRILEANGFVSFAEA